MGIRQWMCPPAAPDFKQIVEKTLTIFAVFTGATFTFYVSGFLLAKNLPPGFSQFTLWDRILVLAAVMALLFRYIIGSAVHLNAAYVPKTTQSVKCEPIVENGQRVGDRFTVVNDNPPTLPCLGWLFFDIVALVGFGILAVFITLADGMSQLLWGAFLFVAAGFAWSMFALARGEVEQAIALRWFVIDGAQAAITFGLMYVPMIDTNKAVVLCIVYLFCLFLDLCVLSRPADVWKEKPKA